MIEWNCRSFVCVSTLCVLCVRFRMVCIFCNKSAHVAIVFIDYTYVCRLVWNLSRTYWNMRCYLARGANALSAIAKRATGRWGQLSARERLTLNDIVCLAAAADNGDDLCRRVREMFRPPCVRAAPPRTPICRARVVTQKQAGFSATCRLLVAVDTLRT